MGVQNERSPRADSQEGNSEISYSKWVFEIRADSQAEIAKSPIVNGYSKFEQTLKQK